MPIFFTFCHGQNVCRTFTSEINDYYYAVVSQPAWHAGDLDSISGPGVLHFRCKNQGLCQKNLNIPNEGGRGKCVTSPKLHF